MFAVQGCAYPSERIEVDYSLSAEEIFWKAIRKVFDQHLAYYTERHEKIDRRAVDCMAMTIPLTSWRIAVRMRLGSMVSQQTIEDQIMEWLTAFGVEMNQTEIAISVALRTKDRITRMAFESREN